ncbi:MAG: hypothetical protein R3D28_23895 [Geminicoccaceae bacterium]
MVLLPGSSVIGGLLVFRAVYFFVPLAIGAPLFGLIELWGSAVARTRRLRPRD